MPSSQDISNDYESRIKALERRVRQLETAPRLADASIDMSDGATRWVDDNGNTIVYIGQFFYAGGSAGYGVLIDRTTGIDVLRYPGVAGGADLQIFDQAGNQIFGDDNSSGTGLARPYISYPLENSSTPHTATFSTTSYTSLFVANFYKQHPEVAVDITAGMSTGGATGTIRLREAFSGDTIATQAITSSADGYTMRGDCSGGLYTKVRVIIEGKRDSGSGSGFVDLASHLIGLQST